MEARTKFAVTGATGRVGRHVVDVLEERGQEVVGIARSLGVDVVTGEGLADALSGVECVIDTATGASPDEEAAAAFFTAASRNLQTAGHDAGVQRMVVVSIIGIDLSAGGYARAKLVHERGMLDGAVPVRILRASQFHEFVEQLVEWGTQGDVAYVPKMRTQLVAARTVAEALVDLAVGSAQAAGPFEIAGPRDENLAAMARLLVARRGLPVRIEEVSDSAYPDHEAWENGGLLPGPHATLAGPTFEEWLDATR